MPMNKEETKQAMKEAMREWMDYKFQEFGRWSFYGLLVAVFGAMVYFILIASGWHKL
jgi:hypothetical protein